MKNNQVFRFPTRAVVYSAIAAVLAGAAVEIVINTFRKTK